MARPKRKSAEATPEAADPIAQKSACEILKRSHDRDVRLQGYAAVDKAAAEGAASRSEHAKVLNDALKSVCQKDGVHRIAEGIRRRLLALEAPVRAHVLLDLEQMGEDYGWTNDVAFLRALVAKTPAPEEQTVFDTTPSGQSKTAPDEAEAAKRAHDAGKAAGNGGVSSATPAPGVPLDEALKAFEANADKAPPVPPAPPRAEGRFRVI